MALAIELLWATMMSPVDIRTLSRAMVFENAGGLYVHRPRSKTQVEVYVDLDGDTARRLKAYLNGTPTTLGDAPIIRGERGGKAFRNRHEFARRFATIRKAAFGEDEKRQMRDIRRSANVEADLGGASADDRAAILGNALNTDPKLERTYTPPTLAKARELRKQREAGRAILRSARGEHETGT
jgi:integrase